MNLIELFRGEGHFQALAAGQPLFFAGQSGDQMYVLMEGQADILLGDDVVESAGPGAIVGEMALVDRGPRSATVIARTDCRLLPIDAGRFSALIQQTPEFARHVMRVMADRIRAMNGRNAQLMEHILRF
ncbi:MAG TPA: cyclic nucleotide-binding domain-containing protein [Burkholderiales bacterium]|nr:cyclic nucleotide-binding domain-containing protein [Burkholderiales bacterium]